MPFSLAREGWREGEEAKTLFDNIYKNRTVLITGHTGFKWSWLVVWLKALGADVVGYADGK